MEGLPGGEPPSGAEDGTPARQTTTSTATTHAALPSAFSTVFSEKRNQFSVSRQNKRENIFSLFSSTTHTHTCDVEEAVACAGLDLADVLGREAQTSATSVRPGGCLTSKYSHGGRTSHTNTFHMAHIGGPSSQLALLRVLPFAAAYAIVGCLVFGFAGVQAQVQTDVVDPNHGSTAVFALLAGDTVVKNDGQYALCSASGIMWHEIDGDGTLAEDPKQHGIGGVPIQLYWANGTLSETTKTKGDGSYIFKIEPGEQRKQQSRRW